MNQNQENLIDELQRKVLQLEGALRLQEEQLGQKEAQLQAQMQQQMQQQQVQQQFQQPIQNDAFAFNMTPKDIIEQFRRLKPLDETHNPRAFIHAVEENLTLCGNNEILTQFCTRIIVNEKILGNAGRRVRELEDKASWEEIKARMLQEFRPRKTYAEIFNFCRTIKVSNLKQLFSIFEKSKYEINDIYLVDQFKPSIYKPENVDRDLVDILLEKIDGPIRAHIGEHETLIEIIMKYTKLKLLDDTRAIAFNHRSNTKYDRKQNYNFHKPMPNNNFQYPNNQEKSERNISLQHRPNYSSMTRNFRQQNLNTIQDMNFNRNSVQQSNYNRFPKQLKSNQTRNSYQSRQQRETSTFNKPEPMDIGNLREQEDVNFSIQPPSQNYP